LPSPAAPVLVTRQLLSLSIRPSPSRTHQVLSISSTPFETKTYLAFNIAFLCRSRPRKQHQVLNAALLNTQRPWYNKSSPRHSPLLSQSLKSSEQHSLQLCFFNRSRTLNWHHALVQMEGGSNAHYSAFAVNWDQHS